MYTFQITPTLLNSFDLYLKAHTAGRSHYAQEIEATLKRTPRVMPAYVEKGNVFEKRVQAYVQNEIAGKHAATVDADYGVHEAGETILSQGTGHFRWQKWLPHYTYTASGLQFKLVGKTDVERDDCIFDIKTTTKPREPEYYLHGWQGPLYCLATKKPSLTFVVAEWENPDNPDDFQVSDVFSCTYTPSSDEQILSALQDKSSEFMSWVIGQNLLEAYTFTYSRNPRV